MFFLVFLQIRDHVQRHMTLLIAIFFVDRIHFTYIKPVLSEWASQINRSVQKHLLSLMRQAPTVCDASDLKPKSP